MNLVVEFLKKRGELHKVSDINGDEEQDDHFDDLARVYQPTILVLGLEWPPPDGDGAGDEGTE